MADLQAPATASSPVDWTELLVGKPSPPAGWWYGLSRDRQVDSLELRASAAVAVLIRPLDLNPGRAPYLKELPRLAAAWQNLLAQSEVFLALGADGLAAAEENLAVVEAARDALLDPRAPGIAPELEELCAAAAALVEVCAAGPQGLTPNTAIDDSHVGLI